MSPSITIKKKRRVCFVITSFIHYSRNILILEELNRREDIDLHIIIGGTALLSKYASKYGNIKTLLKNDGFTKIYELYFNIEGDNPTVKAKTAGLGIVEFSTLFNNIRPDIVMIRGDRFEVLSATLAAAYMNIPIAHIEGGDVSGTIDESVRHAISKLSHLHFVTNEDAKNRLVRMGENPKYIFHFGSPDVELVSKLSKQGLSLKDLDMKKTGSGAHIDLTEGFLMVMYHPVWKDTSEVKKISKNTKMLLELVHEMGHPVLWFWPNVDLGAEDISHEIRRFNDTVDNHKIKFMRYVPPKIFLALLNNAKCLIGNSSSGVKECSYLGIPVVNVGFRQNGRLRANNVIDVAHEREDIKKAIHKQIKVSRYPSSEIYYKKDTAKKIAQVVASAPVDIQKYFFDQK